MDMQKLLPFNTSTRHRTDITTVTSINLFRVILVKVLQEILLSTFLKFAVMSHISTDTSASQVSSSIVENSCCRLAISATSSCFLEIGLHIWLYSLAYDSFYVGAVKTQPKCHSSNNKTELASRGWEALQDGVLDSRCVHAVNTSTILN